MSELSEITAQRDYYRRRWLVHGIRYAMHEYFINKRAGRPKPEIEHLVRAIERDAEDVARKMRAEA